MEYGKDLGLTVSTTLKWDELIKNSLSKANQTIPWVSRNIIWGGWSTLFKPITPSDVKIAIGLN